MRVGPLIAAYCDVHVLQNGTRYSAGSEERIPGHMVAAATASCWNSSKKADRHNSYAARMAASSATESAVRAAATQKNQAVGHVRWPL